MYVIVEGYRHTRLCKVHVLCQSVCECVVFFQHAESKTMFGGVNGLSVCLSITYGQKHFPINSSRFSYHSVLLLLFPVQVLCVQVSQPARRHDKNLSALVMDKNCTCDRKPLTGRDNGEKACSVLSAATNLHWP